MWAMKRNATSMASVKISFRRRSGILKASTAADRRGAFSIGLLGGRRLGVGGADLLDRAARGLDLLARAFRELVGADGELGLEFARAKHLHVALRAAQDAHDLEFLGAD